MTHYVENIGTEDVVFIEVLQADHFSGKWLIIRHCPTVADLCGRCYPCLAGETNVLADISVGQWVGLTPSQIVQDTLNLTDETVSAFKKEKQYIVQGDVPS
jgi:hypothetical protein